MIRKMDQASKRVSLPYMEAEVDVSLFERACLAEMVREQGSLGVGTLGEKTVHAVLKDYYAPRKSCQEQRLGSFVADAVIDGEVLEIQTQSFDRLRRKLEAFLPEHEVTVIYPLIYRKQLRWIHPETGEIQSGRPRTDHGVLGRFARELYCIRPFLSSRQLHFLLPVLEVEEYRLLDGDSRDAKRRATKTDRIPLHLFGEIRIDELRDFEKLLPVKLSEIFTVKEVQREGRMTGREAGLLLLLLYELGIVERIGKQGNAYCYRRKVSTLLLD